MSLAKYFDKPFENKIYLEKTFQGTEEDYLNMLKNSSTLYVGGLQQGIREERLWFLFSILGNVKRVIMGINKSQLVPCGFCFVEYHDSSAANQAVIFFKDFMIDGKKIFVDKDMGFVEGRQFGRGVFGGTVKNDNKKRRIR